jgi:hypothetical protein
MDQFILYIIASLYFFLPAYIANGMPPLVANKTNLLPKLAKPIDGNRKIGDIPILGSHKTWRGLIVELITGTGYFQIMFLLHEYFSLGLYETIGFDQYLINPLIVGFLLSLATVFGDLLFAFIKRRIRIKPGKAFMPFDQTNYVIGSFIFLQPIYHFEYPFWVSLFIMTFFIHVIFNRLGYNLGLHKAKW